MKDFQKELQRTRKALRDKDKELAKAKAEVLMVKKDQVEKVKNGQA
jgi:hypothetical protein